jgi:hypothetical protein
MKTCLGITLVLGWVGTAGCARPLVGTGKEGALYVLIGEEPVAVGLSLSAHVPERAEEHRESMQRWDFQGARLEVDAPAELAVEAVAPEAAGYETSTGLRLWGGFRLKLRCLADTGGPREVRLRVMAGAEERSRDAVDVTCVEPTGMALVRLGNVPWASETPGVGRHFVGGRVEAWLELFADGPGGRTLLTGLRDLGLVLREESGMLAWDEEAAGVGFTVARAGEAPRLVYRNVALTLPMEAVEDPGWTLEVRDWEASGGRLEAQARGSDGRLLEGLGSQCAWTVEPSNGATWTGAGCRSGPLGETPVRACVSAHGRTACRSFR